MKEKYDELKTNYDVAIKEKVLTRKTPKGKTKEKVPEYLFDLIYRYSENHFKSNHELFIGLIEDIKDDNNEKYLDVDIKRKFFDIISEQMPSLVSLIRLFILNANVINNAKTANEIDGLVKKLAFGGDSFNYKYLQKLFIISEIGFKSYAQYARDTIFFPELILPEIFKTYNTFISKIKVNIDDLEPVGYDKIDMDVIKDWLKLQISESLEDNISIFCKLYLMEYLTSSGRADHSDIMEKFIEVLNKLLTNF